MFCCQPAARTRQDIAFPSKALFPSSTDHGTSATTWEQNNALAAKYTYDDNGNVLTVEDRYGQVATNTYDWADRLETTQPPNITDTTSGEVIRTTYKTLYAGPMGRVSEEQIKEEHSTGGQTGWATDRDFYFVKKYTYDRAGRTIIVELPTHSLAGVDYYAYQDTYYDENGNVIQSQLRQVNQGDPNDVTTWPTYREYDAANRVVKESKVVSTATDTYDRVETTYEYDPAGRQTAVNRGGLVIQRTFDRVGRVTETRTSSGAAYTRSEAELVGETAASWRRYRYDESGNRIEYSDPIGVFASVTYDCENRPIAVTDRAGRVTRRRYWPLGQLKQVIHPDGSFIGYEYDIEGRLTRIWESVPEQNSAQSAGPFGQSEHVALTKTVDYYTGKTMDQGTGQNISWSGTQINSGAYVSAVRTFTYKGAGPVYYDMVYTRNARGQAEETHFIDADDSTTRITTRFYTWRDQLRRLTHPDGNSLDYTYDDHLRLTKEELQGASEYYEYSYCLCGAIKKHRYHYVDSLDDAQNMDWEYTLDGLGRKLKEYYPYAIAKVGNDEYHSILWEYDRASRREMFSDPTYGHHCADTSGWSNYTEPTDEDDWVFDEPQRYRYGLQGNLRATGRVKGSEIRSGEGEPYFVVRDEAGRVARVIYPDATGKNKPQLELRYEYGAGGQLIRVSAVDMTSASLSTYGPERYVIEYSYDETGRLVRKCVRANQVEDSAIQYESDYGYDGRGQLVRERILRWDETAEQMKVTQDVQYTYDLGRNVTQVKLTDDKGWVYTETRSYARGYQLTDFSEEHATGVMVIALGSYTYDTNNNMTGTKSIDVRHGDASERLVYRAQWTFTFDRKNRVASHTNQETDLVRHLRWDGLGRVWQRWDYDSVAEEWSATLTRYTYDGSALAQEHLVAGTEVEGAWTYAYMYLTYDYLRHAAGTRQRKGEVDKSYTDYFLLSDMGTVSGRLTRGSTVALEKAQRVVAGDRQARYSGEGAEPTGSPFTDVSNLGFVSTYIESYGGTKSGDAQFFDALNQMGSRHYLPGLGVYLNRRGNCPYSFAGGAAGTAQVGAGLLWEWPWEHGGDGNGGEDGWTPPPYGDTEQDFAGDPTGPCPDCCLWILMGIDPYDPHKPKLKGPLYDYSSNPGWCNLCCGSKVITGPCYDEAGREWGVTECWLQCCHEKTPPDTPGSEHMLDWILSDQGCLVLDESKWKPLLDKIGKVLERSKIVQFIACLMRGGNIASCLLEVFGFPGGDDLVDFVDKLLDAIPIISVDCCEKLVEYVLVEFPGEPLPADKIEDCCEQQIGGLAKDIRNYSRFLHNFRCCYYCHPERGLSDVASGAPVLGLTPRRG